MALVAIEVLPTRFALTSGEGAGTLVTAISGFTSGAYVPSHSSLPLSVFRSSSPVHTHYLLDDHATLSWLHPRNLGSCEQEKREPRWRKQRCHLWRSIDAITFLLRTANEKDRVGKPVTSLALLRTTTPATLGGPSRLTFIPVRRRNRGRLVRL
ncbi:hypothetical protein PENSPDRAFT_321397 [Peniophora sp. CONT]|nr:hypothetical protein PENSPDRAFT_321397 [Peniophora sp. CONT]